ncbi:MAG: outer membrane lipoprotein carrier protein LolA [Bacteroidales bacterium]|nr:outer membrane lipoprotein carrier protein LolA [Bacteroidales bacterium]
MKRFFLCIAAVLAFAAMSSAQTTDEIIARMDSEMSKIKPETGMRMGMDIGLPIIGTTRSNVWILGEKTRMEVSLKDEKSTIWMDGTTTWTYTPKDNEVVIENRKPSDNSTADDGMGLVNSVTEGYDVKLEKETADAWYFNCTKSKSNTKKDDPKKMSLVVDKKTYIARSLTAKMKGISITLRDMAAGATADDVTFDPSKLPGVMITDKR